MYALILFSRETIGPWKIVLNKSQTNFIQHRLWPGVSSFSLRAILYTNSCGCLSKSEIVLELWPLRYFSPCSSYFLFLAVRENTKVNAFPASLQSVMRRLLQQTSWRSRIISDIFVGGTVFVLRISLVMSILYYAPQQRFFEPRKRKKSLSLQKQSTTAYNNVQWDRIDHTYNDFKSTTPLS